MYVLHFYPWGQFVPPTSGADFVACNQLEYLQARGAVVDCLVPRGFGRGSDNLAAITSRFPCVRTIDQIDIHCPKFELAPVLAAFARAADGSAFRAIAARGYDLFFSNYVLSAPLALDFPQSVRRIVETHDLQVGMFRTIALLGRDRLPMAICDAEQHMLFRTLETDLYRAFDVAVMISPDETERVESMGVDNAHYVPQMFPVTAHNSLRREPHQPFDLVFVGSENHLNTGGLHRFYREVYLPHLRGFGVRLLLAGRVCEQFDVLDSQVRKLGTVPDLGPVYDLAKLTVVPIFEGTGVAIKTREAMGLGRAVVTTPVGARGLDATTGAFAVVDMDKDPAGAAAVIRGLLADEPRRWEMRQRAVQQITETHGRSAYFSAMDRVTRLGPPPQSRAA